MAWLKYKADSIFNGQKWLDPEMVLVTDDTGKILDFIPAAAAGEEVRRYQGILCPGFINAHCHLELSHLKGRLPEGQGLPAFLQQVMQTRETAPAEVVEAMRESLDRMYAEGISAVGDICNTAASLSLKREGPMRWVNFIEVLSTSDAKAPERLQHFRTLRDRYLELPGCDGQPPTASLAAHAPYSTSPLSFHLINQETAGRITSLHNQESAAEDELYRSGKGAFLPFFQHLGYANSPMPVTGSSSLQSVLPYFDQGQRLLLVHNTYTSPEDLVFAAAHAARSGLDVVYCLCPNANLYIEGRLPPVADLLACGAHIVLGTDSLASNHELSIAAEMRTLLHHFPRLGWETVLRWSTSEGAAALGLHDSLGSLRKGTRPGLVWLDEKLQAKRLH